MSTITIKDLPGSRLLDCRALAAIRGGGAPWVFGWIRPYVAAAPTGGGAVFNFYQINNYAEQMINQIQVVDVTNSAANSNINIALAENSTNNKNL